MKIYLVRHGEANPVGVDPEKGLSDKGKIEITRVAELISHLNISVAEIYHSGKARAEQTAMILSQAIKSDKGISQRNGLNPNDPVMPVVEELKAREENMMIVGHMPFMAMLESMMLSHDDHHSVLEWTTGSAACIEYDKGKCILRWFLNPQIAAGEVSGQFSSYH